MITGTIRLLDPANRAERRRVLQLIYQSQYVQHVVLERRDSEEENRINARAVWRWNLTHPEMTYYVYEREGTILGYVLLRRLPDATAFIDDFGVEVTARRQGIGRELLQFAFAWARKEGLTVMKLTTQRNNAAAIAAYLSAGFTRVPSEYVDFTRRI